MSFLATTDFTVLLALIVLAATVTLTAWAIRSDRANTRPPIQLDRVRMPDDGIDIHRADPYFYGSGAPCSTAMAATRISTREKDETRTVPAAGSRTTKGVTQ